MNYRYQALEEGPGRPAFSPRVSAIIRHRVIHGIGSDHNGLQVNLPFSKQHGDFYLHANGGFTWLPRGEDLRGMTSLLFDRMSRSPPRGSVIYRLRPMLHLMLESVLGFAADDTPEGNVGYTRVVTLSPGVRGGWNVAKDAQVIIGAAVPVTWTTGQSSVGLFGYFSYELPFKK